MKKNGDGGSVEKEKRGKKSGKDTGKTKKKRDVCVSVCV